MALQTQLVWLFVLSLPVACIAWTVTHEEVFKEVHVYCLERSKTGKTLFLRKFFYLFTCEYCFSHYVTVLLLIITKYTLLYTDWRGYLIAGFSMVWIANLYMSLFVLLRMDIKKERAEATIKEEQVEKTINN